MYVFGVSVGQDVSGSCDEGGDLLVMAIFCETVVGLWDVYSDLLSLTVDLEFSSGKRRA
jgi:hypothetical protein